MIFAPQFILIGAVIAVGVPHTIRMLELTAYGVCQWSIHAVMLGPNAMGNRYLVSAWTALLPNG